jgi:hypothetical protein
MLRRKFFSKNYSSKNQNCLLYLSSKTIKMKSPFLGMNPWLEGYLWLDVQQALASVISEMIAPLIAPKYVTHIAPTMIMDYDPVSEIGITYPKITPEPNSEFIDDIPFKLPIKSRTYVVELRDAANNKLITAIEILSPVNKRNPNLIDYRKKIDDLHKRGVHVIEIDLLRRGTRPFSSKKVLSHYQMMLLRAQLNNALIWSVNIQDKLPVLPVPLRAPDLDVFLDLGNAMDIIFERSLYYLSIDYAKDPAPPVFAEQDLAFIQEIVNQK